MFAPKRYKASGSSKVRWEQPSFFHFEVKDLRVLLSLKTKSRVLQAISTWVSPTNGFSKAAKVLLDVKLSVYNFANAVLIVSHCLWNDSKYKSIVWDSPNRPGILEVKLTNDDIVQLGGAGTAKDTVRSKPVKCFLFNENINGYSYVGELTDVDLKKVKKLDEWRLLGGL